MLFRIFRRLPPPKLGTFHFGTPAIVEGAPGTSAGGERKWLGCLGWLRPSWNLKRLHRHQISYFPSTAGSYFFQVTMDIVTSLEHRFCFRFQTFKKTERFWLGFATQKKNRTVFNCHCNYRTNEKVRSWLYHGTCFSFFFFNCLAQSGDKP